MKIGLGTTGMCNLKCPHCYSRRFDGKHISLSDVKRIIELSDIESVNFGTGENILNPDFRAILRIFHDNKIKMALTTNGYTVSQLEDEYLLMFNDIDFSLEFPDREAQNAYRGQGSWELVLAGLQKCESLGVDTSIACALMNSNAKSIFGFQSLLNDFNTSLRINVIKRGEFLGERKNAFTLDYNTFWSVFKRLFKEYKLISCSEPILCVALDHKSDIKGSPCGQHSMRIQPDGSVLPCVYWPVSSSNIRDKLFALGKISETSEFKRVKIIPLFCCDCIHVDICMGGCAARRILSGNIDSPDEFCPLVHGDVMPKINANYSEGHYDLVHSTYLCTIIFNLDG